MGRYGLLNNTIQEIIARQRAANTLTPEVKALSGLDQDAVRQQVESNPALESQLATYLANHVLQRQGGNELAAAYAWNNGHNLPAQKITPEKLDSSPYVQKYKSFSGQKPVAPVEPEPMNLDIDRPDALSDRDDARQVQAAYDALLRLRNNN